MLTSASWNFECSKSRETMPCASSQLTSIMLLKLAFLSSVFRDLGDAAIQQAQSRSLSLHWGTDQSNQRS
jgi:hypothetical protein